MSNRSNTTTDELCVLNDIHFFNFTTRRWLPAPVDIPNPELIPRARYAHLSSVTGDRLVIIGGQDFHNAWLDDICHFNLLTQAWTQQQYPRHCGTYRSVAVSSPTVIRTPHTEDRPTSTLGLPGKRFPSRSVPGPPPETTPSENLIHLPYLAAPTEDHPSEIYLYSNYNVRRISPFLFLHHDHLHSSLMSNASWKSSRPFQMANLPSTTVLRL